MSYEEFLPKINDKIWEERNILLFQKHGKNFEHIIKSSRFDTYVFKGKNSKNKMKEFMLLYPENKIAVQIYNVKNYRQFVSFPSWDVCWNKYINTAWNKRYLNEMILVDKPCKPYLDIEWIKDSDNINEYDFILQLINDIILVFQKRYNITITENDFYITEAHSETKISFHLVITTKEYQLLYKTNVKKENNSAYDLYSALVENNHNYEKKLDGCVYSKDREMRCIYSTKFDQVRLFIPITIPDIKNKKNTHNVRRTSDFIPNFHDYLITHLSNLPIQFINTPEVVHPVLLPSNKYNIDKSDNDKLAIIKNFTQKEPENDLIERLIVLASIVHPTAKYTGRVGDGYRFTYDDRTEPCYTGHIHKSNGFSVFIKPNTGFVYMFCFSARCGKLFKLGHLYNVTNWDVGAKVIEFPFIEYLDKNEIYFEKKDVNVTNFLSNFIQNKGIACIKSGMGTGKTKTLISLVRGFFADKRIMYLSYRQTLSKNIEGTIPEFYNYMNDATDLHLKDKIIIQIDSLPKLGNNGEYFYYDFIIMDEIESLLYHMNSKTIKERMLVCEILEQFIKGAPWIIALDADFGQRAYDFLSEIKQKPRIIINNFKPKQKRVFYFSKNYEKRMFQIHEDLKNKKNIVIVTLAIGIANEIFKQIKDYNVVLHTSMTDDKLKEELIHVNSFWTQKQAVIYTPTIDAGIDFNVKDYFDVMYCFACKLSSTPRSLLQATGRIRHLKDNNIRTHIHPSMFTKGKKILSTLVEEEDFIIKQSKHLTKTQIEEIGENKFKLITCKNHYTKLFAHNRMEKAYSESIFFSILKELIVSKGNDYVNEDLIDEQNEENQQNEQSEQIEENDAASTSTHSKTNEIVIRVDTDAVTSRHSTKKSIYEIEDLIDSPDIDSEEYERLEIKKGKNKATGIEKLSIKKFILKRKLKIESFAYETDEQKNDLIEFLSCWYNKEYILDNALCALGKKQYNDSDDPYFSNMSIKIEHLNKILNIFGFKGLLDFETKVESNEELEKRMIASRLLTKANYSRMMKTFDKREQAKDIDGKFEVKKFMKLCNCIMNEFGFNISSLEKKRRNKKKFHRDYLYYIKPQMINIEYIISSYYPK